MNAEETLRKIDEILTSEEGSYSERLILIDDLVTEYFNNEED